MGNYSPIVTNAGAAAIAAARVSGVGIDYTQIAVGDSNGVSYTPTSSQTALVHEVWRGNIAPGDVYVHPNNANWVVTEIEIPMTDGGFDIREAGVYNSDGVLIAVSRYPLTTKPAPGSGSEKNLIVRMIFEVTSAAEVTHIIDSSVASASKEYVDSRLHFARLATTSNIASMSGTQTIDGVVANIGDRVLVRAQTTQSQNGVYVVNSGAWTRATDFNSAENVLPASLVAVAEGNIYKDSLFILMSDSGLTVGTTSLTFRELISRDSSYNATSGIKFPGTVGAGFFWLDDGTYTANFGSDGEQVMIDLSTAETDFDIRLHGSVPVRVKASGAVLIGNEYADTTGGEKLIVTGGSKFTASPTAPTPASGDNTTKLATTAFVNQALSGKSDVGHSHDTAYVQRRKDWLFQHVAHHNRI